MFDQREKNRAPHRRRQICLPPRRPLGFDIDYRKLLEAFRKRAYLLRANYYCALVENEETAYNPAADRLARLQWIPVVTKPVREFTDSLGRRKVKGNHGWS
ncbi:NYN domain-containing protein (plasmid) [Sinorhizobium meliloti]|nr:NYN domain-containing protein [Sinorhizobium meliloti]